MLVQGLQSFGTWFLGALVKEDPIGLGLVLVVGVGGVLAVVTAPIWMWLCLGAAKVRSPYPVAAIAVVMGAVSMAASLLASAMGSGCGTLVEEPTLPAGGLTTVPSVAPNTLATPAAAFRLHLEAGLPLHFKGIVPTSDLEPWTPSRFRDVFGSVNVTYQVSQVEQGETKTVTDALDAFLDATLAPTGDGDGDIGGGSAPPYLSEWPMAAFDGTAYDAYVRAITETLVAPDVLGLTYLWMGPKGARTGLHADHDPRNVLFQLYGTKTVWVLPITENGYVYPSTKFDNGATLSQVDPFHPDLDAFPLYTNATPVPVHLTPGDALFIPSGWFHHAESTSFSVSLSSRSYTLCEAVASLPSTVVIAAHNLGLYRAGDCTCHDS